MRPAISLLLLWVTLAFAGERGPPIDVIPQNTYPPGQTTFLPVTIEVGTTEVTLAFGRDLWTNPKHAATFGLDVSYTGGATWGNLVAASAVQGTEASTSVTGFPEQPENPDRMVRGFFTVHGPPLTTRGILIRR